MRRRPRSRSPSAPATLGGSRSLPRRTSDGRERRGACPRCGRSRAGRASGAMCSAIGVSPRQCRWPMSSVSPNWRVADALVQLGKACHGVDEHARLRLKCQADTALVGMVAQLAAALDEAGPSTRPACPVHPAVPDQKLTASAPKFGGDVDGAARKSSRRSRARPGGSTALADVCGAGRAGSVRPSRRRSVNGAGRAGVRRGPVGRATTGRRD